MNAGFPTDFDELADLLNRAKTAWDVFRGDVSARYRRFAKLCHSDRFREPSEKTRAEAVFRRLAEWRELAETRAAPRVISSANRQYAVLRQLAAGDLADVHLATSDHVEFVLKVTRPIAGNPLLVTEARRLKALAARSGDRRYREYLPRLAESFILRDADGSRQVNAFAQLTEFLVERNIETEEILNEWLIDDSNGASLRTVRGIGPKSVDYLKALVGVPTVAVDRHIRTFVGWAGLTLTTYEEIRAVVCEAADILHVGRSALDHAIWSFVSNANSAPSSARKLKVA